MSIRISALVLSAVMLFGQPFFAASDSQTGTEPSQDVFQMETEPSEDTYEMEPAVAAGENPFAALDDERRATLEKAVSPTLDISEWSVEDPTPVNLDISYIVKFTDTCLMSDMASILDGEDFDLIGYSSNRTVRISAESIDAFLAKAGTNVQYCEKDDYCAYIPTALPNDQYYEYQYAHDILNIPEAWSYSKGSDNVIVAVLDTGLYRSHEDFSGLPMLPGQTYIDGGSGPCTYDCQGHGTMVTGVIAATSNNSIGVSGICKNVTIMPMQCFNSNGSATSADIMDAIYDSADAGADVLNMSFSGPYDQGIEQAINYANSKNCILVAAAGNGGEYGEYYAYPASLSHVISCGSIGETKSWSYFSTYNDALDVAAPGEAIATTTFDGGYGVPDGTSFSCPEVAAIAALARTLDSGLTSDEYHNIATSTATDIDASGYDKKTGYGIINAEKLLKELAGDDYEEVAKFVTRFYKLCLGRTPDEDGLKNWCNQLINKTKTGSDVAYGFIFSKEFINAKKTNSEYVEILYKAFFNREADSAGKKSWMNALSSGLSRKYVLAGFVGSSEFSKLAASYGINAGKLKLTEPRDLYPNITKFVARFYKECLGRTADAAGLNQWVGDLQSGKTTGAKVAYGFVFSKEFVNKKVSNGTYVTILYTAFFNRTPDKAGYDSWVKKLNNGTDRKTVLAGFVNSKEFADLAAKYGIQPGTL